ncbi:MAG: hypothetical protein JNK53_04385 [Phycisphaerae bacterium]|nr:hypothetical protein [Phycisphaerae bacterium]
MKFNTVLTLAFASLSTVTAVHAETIYNCIPGTLAGSYPSLAYQATQSAQIGDRVTFGGTNRQLSTATFTMVTWASLSGTSNGGPNQPGFANFAGNTSDNSGYMHSFTLNIFEAGTGYQHGALLGSLTVDQFIPYRPEGWSFNGYAFNMTFDLTSLGINAPDSIVYGLATNTQSWGANPTGDGNAPYNALNFGLNTAAGGGVTAGSTDLDSFFWQTATAGWYTDGGANGVNTFRLDDNWTGYNPMARFEAVPAPGALALLGLAGLTRSRRRRGE